jgi:hypothetical protein
MGYTLLFSGKIMISDAASYFHDNGLDARRKQNAA